MTALEDRKSLTVFSAILVVRLREILLGLTVSIIFDNFGTLSTLAISGHQERFSPGGHNGSEVGCPARLFEVI